jgi:D-sedoheptulose 7-phosphate isomerase
MSQEITDQIDAHITAVQRVKSSETLIQDCAASLIESFRAGKRLYVFGNGGSAADAQHIAAELVGRFKSSDKPPLPAIALTTDSSNLTAIGNDFGFEEIFKRQVEALVQEGDVVWALSVSGSSANVLRAVREAKKCGASVIGFTGLEGAQLRELCDLCLVVEHGDSDRVQEVHQLAYHIICGLIEKAFTAN